jgi:catalase
MILFSDRGTPASVRHINGYSGHTYKLTKEDGSFVYVKFHFKTNQGVKTLTNDESVKMAGEDPDHHTADLYNSIKKGDYPSWTVYIQVMTPEQAKNYRWNIFDMTKVWPHSDFPLQPVGKLTLNRNVSLLTEIYPSTELIISCQPTNYFTDIEQAAFSPSTMVAGIAPSADPMLQARMFAYPDAARYRLGVNYQQLPCNAPVSPVYTPYQRDGAFRYTSNYGGDPNYVRSSLRPIKFVGSAGTNGQGLSKHDEWVGQVAAYTSEVTPEDYAQATAMWEVLRREGIKQNFVHNVTEHLKSADPQVQRATFREYWVNRKYLEYSAKNRVEMFEKVNVDLARMIEESITAVNKS